MSRVPSQFRMFGPPRLAGLLHTRLHDLPCSDQALLLRPVLSMLQICREPAFSTSGHQHSHAIVIASGVVVVVVVVVIVVVE